MMILRKKNGKLKIKKNKLKIQKINYKSVWNVLSNTIKNLTHKLKKLVI